MIPYSDVIIKKIIDGGYLTWAHGAIGFKSWQTARTNYSRRAGALICLDSRRSFRKEFDPNYKSHRKDKREQRPKIHEKVMFFQEYIREDPTLRTWEVDGLEADDLIAILVGKFKLPVTALDKDLLQIPTIQMNKIDNTEVLVTNFALRQAKMIRPLVEQNSDVLFILTLLGDKSDDIPRLIPSRNLDLLVSLMRSPSPWEAALELFGDRLLHNLYLAVLPGPWCFYPTPSQKEVFKQVLQGTWPKGVLRYNIQEFIQDKETPWPQTTSNKSKR